MKDISNVAFRETIFSLTETAIYFLSPTGHVITWNLGARRMKGWEERDITGQHFSLFYCTAEREEFLPESNLEIARTQGCFQGEGWRLRRDGSAFRADVLLECLYATDGTVEGYVKIIRDVTQAHENKMALELSRTQIDIQHREISESARFLKDIIMFIPQIFIVVDATMLNVIIASRDTARITRMSPTTMTGLPLSKTLPAPIAENFAQMITDATKSARNVRSKFIVDIKSEKRVFNAALTQLNGISGEKLFLLTADEITKAHNDSLRLYHLAHHDPLTGLANRITFMTALEASLANHEHLAILAIDLDRFKRINDSLGHAAGDELLKSVARRLLTVLRVTDLVARIGGDEFIVMLKPIFSMREAEDISTRLFDLFDNYFSIGSISINIGISIGVALSERNSNSENLLAAADAALYYAKYTGRNRKAFYTPAVAAAKNRRETIEKIIDNALDKKYGRINISYRPVKDYASGIIKAREAFMTVNNHSTNDISQQEVINVAEETGKILILNNFLLYKACRDAVSWNKNEILVIDLSGKQLMDPAFFTMLSSILTNTGLAPQRLEFIIKGSFLLEDEHEKLVILEELQKKGVGLILGDFGKGFSMHSYIKGFTFNKVKIEFSLIKRIRYDLTSKIFLAGMLRTCAEMNITVIVEGGCLVPWEWLAAQGCHLLMINFI